MAVVSKEVKVNSSGEGDLVDITIPVASAVAESKLTNGTVTVFVPGSTGAVSTIEFEPGLRKDFPEALERIAPSNIDYEHNKTWGCDNGRSHVKATLLGPSLTVPFTKGRLMLGTWQQIVFIELDTKSRDRKIIIQIVGE